MKSENTIYHVIPTGARWKVVGEEGTPSYHSTEAEAVTTAREWAMVKGQLLKRALPATDD
jgi:hypothetical protein